MENYRKDGFVSRSENRREYGNDRNQERNYTGGYSQAGRKLRHRKGFTGNTENSQNPSESRRNSYTASRDYSYGSSERRNYNTERRSFGAGRYSGEGYGEQSDSSYGYREHSDRSSFGNRRPAGRSTGYGSSRSFGQGDRRRSFGENSGMGSGYGDSQGRRPSPDSRRKGAAPARGRKPAMMAKKKQVRKPTGAELGINRMISRKPQLDDTRFSDNDMVKVPIKEEVRLNKYIANSGVCSRREADNLILAGVVTVNGEVITELGTKVNVLTDDVRFNGERLKGEEKVYIVMNKPKGYVTTASDPHADKTVMDLMKGCKSRVFPVGRLDKNTTGVLMFTNDGEIAEKLTHPAYDKKKIYQVTLDKELAQEDYDHIMEGIELSDGMIAADELEYIDENDHRKLGIEIHSGKNRIVRRIFESLGYTVKALDRVYFAGLTKKSLKRGQWRFLTEGETNVLKMGAYV